MTNQISLDVEAATFIAREFLSDHATDASVVTAVVETFTEDSDVLEITSILTMGDGVSSFVNFDFGLVTSVHDRDTFQEEFTANLDKLNRLLNTITEFRTAYADAGLDVLGVSANA